MKCMVCSVGNVTQSGCHLYCDKCSFVAFSMTADYIDSCAGVLATLISNTKFKEEKDITKFILSSMESHLPRLYYYLQSLESGKAELLASLVDQAQAQAINVDTSNDLVCRCGSKEFSMNSIAELICKQCDAVYRYNEEEGIYKPYFDCICGSVKYTYAEEGSHLVVCDNCNRLYAHDSRNKVFYRQKLGGNPE